MSRKTKNMIKMVACVMAAVFGIVLLGNITSGFQNLNPADWELRSVNEANLYQQMAFAEEDGVFADGADGITVKLNEDDNSLKIDGCAEIDKAIAIGSVTLKANTDYLFDASLNNGTNKTVYAQLVDAEGTVIAKSYTGPVVIAALAEETDVTLQIVVKADTSLRRLTLKPIICEGNDVDNIIGYYA